MWLFKINLTCIYSVWNSLKMANSFIFFLCIHESVVAPRLLIVWPIQLSGDAKTLTQELLTFVCLLLFFSIYKDFFLFLFVLFILFLYHCFNIFISLYSIYVYQWRNISFVCGVFLLIYIYLPNRHCLFCFYSTFSFWIYSIFSILSDFLLIYYTRRSAGLTNQAFIFSFN